jgi:hypothetical protein
VLSREILTRKEKRAGDVAQLIEQLPTKREALSSHPVPGKKKVTDKLLCIFRVWSFSK